GPHGRVRKDETHARRELELRHDRLEVVAVGAQAVQPDHGVLGLAADRDLDAVEFRFHRYLLPLAAAAARKRPKNRQKFALADLRIVCTICASLFIPPPANAERYCRSARAPASHCSPARSARDSPPSGARRAAARGEFSRDAVEREPRSA